MANVHVSTVLPVPARMVWDTIGGFNSLAKWHPAVARSEESKEGTATVRRLTLHGGGSIVERLEHFDNNERLYTLPLGIMQFQGQFGTDWSRVLAFVSLALIPTLIFYLLAERHIVSGLTTGAVKG